MRIAMFMPELAPDALGSLIYRDLAEAMARLGHPFERLGTSDRLSSTAGDSSVKCLPLSRAWLGAGALAAPVLRTRTFLALAATLRSYLADAAGRFDVLHIEIAYPTGAAAALAVAASGWRGLLSITPMGEDVLVVEDALYGFRRHPLPRALLAWALRRADVVRCISPLIQGLVDRHWRVKCRRTIPLNVARKAVAFLEEPPEARRERRLRARQALEMRYPIGDRQVVLALGRLHPFKGLDVLVEAMSAVPDAHLLIAGPSLHVHSIGDAASHLAVLAHDRGLEGRVHFLGKVPPPEALDLLGGADAVAVPSLLESLNRVCVEAAAAGTPFVATETTGVTGWIPGPGVGLVVPPRNPAALATALNYILRGEWRADPELVARFVARFSPERVAGELVELYASALGAAHVKAQ